MAKVAIISSSHTGHFSRYRKTKSQKSHVVRLKIDVVADIKLRKTPLKPLA